MSVVRRLCVALGLLAVPCIHGQVASYTFSTEVGIWQPIGGNGTPLGMSGLPWPFTFDDNSFVTAGESLPLGSATTGNGWPIGFTFTFNGHAYDRVGISMEGWLAFGQSANGISAVYVPVGTDAYGPLSSSLPLGMDPLKRNRVSAFGMDLAALGNGGLWPVQIYTAGAAPNRIFVVEWNVVRSGGSNTMSFQIRLNEGGGDPAAQTVQVVYGTMVQTASLTGQVGLAGDGPGDFNNRSVAASPYDWQQSAAGTGNTATCRPPSSATYLPQGLTFTWTPAGCVVTGITIADLAIATGNITGTLTWAPLPGAASYAYIITTGSPDDPVVSSGTGLTTTAVDLDGLPVGQQLFAYVRADCGEGMQGWGAGQPFTTEGYVEVVCGTAPVASTYCYVDLDQRSWHYTGTTDAPLRLIIHAGTIHTGDLLTVYDGPTDQSPVLFSSANGTVAGQVINSSGPQLTMKLVADDVGCCAVHEFILPLEWEVGCVDCDPVFANFSVLNDCPNGQFSVDVQVYSMGSAATLLIGSDANGTTVPANGTGTYTIGPFAIGTPVTVTAANPDNAYCSAVSMPLLNAPCPVVGCGPQGYTYCYTDDDAGQWAYQSPGTERIGIRFTSGTLAAGDEIRLYDGLDPFMSAPLFVGSNNGNLNGLMRATSTGNADHALLLEVAANGSSSCTTGQAAPWQYIVACYDGCTAPAATFSTLPDCEAGTYSVVVELTSLGSATTVGITNNAGAPALSASTAGTFLAGPFPIGQAAVVEVEGASVLCSVNSDEMNEECGIGIREEKLVQMHVFPNPGDGIFRLALPMGFGGVGQLEVLDVTGRSVARRVLRGESGLGVDCNLGYLPAGRYVLLVSYGNNRAYAPVSIVH
ncbi:MAG: hypothetical protein KBH07_07645 [Flavobacteriales bacterium]|nr:hypothetical protein [Flavobacteriales bacterium]MBP9080309.1 hypothetical protein [Flavobacteriales bacterium]